MTLIATGRANRTSSALSTSAIPPVPITSRTWNGPSIPKSPGRCGAIAPWIRHPDGDAVRLCPHGGGRTPPEAAFDHFDGRPLAPEDASARPGRFTPPFVLPSGRACGTFDELVAGCLEEWP